MEAGLGRLLALLGTLMGAGLVGLAWVDYSPWTAAVLAALWALAAVRPAYAIAVLFVAVPIDQVRPIFGIAISLSELELTAVAAGCAVAWRSGLRGLDWRPLAWGAPFTLVLLVSALLHNEWPRVLPHVLRLSELTVALWLAGNAAAGVPRRLFGAAVAAAAVVFPIAGLLQFPVAPGGRVWSFFGNPNQFAGYLNLLLPTVFASLLASGPGRWGWAVLFWLVAVSGLAAQSRAALFAGAVSLMAVALLAARAASGDPERKPLALARRLGPAWISGLVLTGALAGLMMLVSPSLREGLRRWLGELEGRSVVRSVRETFSQRLPFYLVGLEIWREHPWLGVGPGNYERAVRDHRDLVESYRRLSTDETFAQTVVLHPHNLYLQVAAEAGAAGLAAFLFLLGRLGLGLLRGPPGSLWRRAGIGVLTAFLVHNLLDSTFPSLGIETGLMLGMAWGMGSVSRRPVKASTAPAGRAGSERPHTAEERSGVARPFRP